MNKDKKWKDLKKLYKLGLSLRDIAAIKHCSHEWVRLQMQKQGIKLRPVGGKGD